MDFIPNQEFFSAMERQLDELHDSKNNNKCFGSGQPLNLGSDHKMVDWAFRGEVHKDSL